MICLSVHYYIKYLIVSRHRHSPFPCKIMHCRLVTALITTADRSEKTVTYHWFDQYNGIETSKFRCIVPLCSGHCSKFQKLYMQMGWKRCHKPWLVGITAIFKEHPAFNKSVAKTCMNCTVLPHERIMCTSGPLATTFSSTQSESHITCTFIEC